MLREFVRVWSGVEDTERDVTDNKRDIEDTHQDVKDLEEELVSFKEEFASYRRDTRQTLEKIQSEVSGLREDVETYREQGITEDDLSSLESRLRDLEGVGETFTDREWQLIQILVEKQDYVSTDLLSNELGISKNNVRAVLSNVDDKLDLESKKQGRKKLYSVSEETVNNLYSDNID